MFRRVVTQNGLQPLPQSLTPLIFQHDNNAYRVIVISAHTPLICYECSENTMLK